MNWKNIFLSIIFSVPMVWVFVPPYGPYIAMAWGLLGWYIAIGVITTRE
jgi:hypothetical protein